MKFTNDMQVVFDITAIEILRLLGYRYYCNFEISAPDPDPNGGLCAYWEMVPFRTKASALKANLQARQVNVNNQLWSEEEHVEELAGGVLGLIVYLKFPNPQAQKNRDEN